MSFTAEASALYNLMVRQKHKKSVVKSMRCIKNAADWCPVIPFWCLCVWFLCCHKSHCSN